MAWVHCAPGNVYEFDWPSSYVHQYEKTTISAISRSSTFGLDRLRYGTVGCRKAGFDNNPWTEKPVGRAGIAVILHLCTSLLCLQICYILLRGKVHLMQQVFTHARYNLLFVNF